MEVSRPRARIVSNPQTSRVGKSATHTVSPPCLRNRYGFKSIKFVTEIRFATAAEFGGEHPPTSRTSGPPTFWSVINGNEYGFYANVNPQVDHPRWSQATERVLVDSTYGGARIDTQLFNGYAPEVSYLYESLGLPDDVIFR